MIKINLVPILRSVVAVALLCNFFSFNYATETPKNVKLSSKELPHEKPPNIIFILADDMGYGDISALNPESKIQTPVLDKLVKEGKNFTEAHSSASICTPTRYALLTGRYSFRTGLNGVATGYSKPMIEYERETLASLLKRADYTTACIGKWHLGLEWQPKDQSKPIYTKDVWIPENLNVDYTKPVKGVNELGFDYSFISPGGNNIAPFCFVKNGIVTEQPTEFIAPQIQGHTYKTRRNGGDKAPGFALDQTLTVIKNETIRYLQSIKTTDKPFFLYLPLTAPHFPWLPSKEFKGTSKAGLYGDYVQEIDYRTGEILQALKKLNLDKNTLIIFTADNGGAYEPFFKKYDHEMNKGRRGQKHQIWEGGVRVPFIAHWKGVIKPGSVCHKRISMVDMLATFSALINQPFDQKYGEDSYNVSSLLLDGNDSTFTRGAMINQAVKARALSIIKDHWKLIPYGYGDSGLEPPKPGQPKGQLYNLRQDSLEENNLYNQYPEIVQDLSYLLAKYKKQGYSRPMKEPN